MTGGVAERSLEVETHPGEEEKDGRSNDPEMQIAEDETRPKQKKKITQILKTVPDNFSCLSVADYFNHLRHFLCVLPSQKTGGCLSVKE